MAARTGRVVCSQCGANNFDTVSSCWKCNAPLASNGNPFKTADVPLRSAPTAPDARAVMQNPPGSQAVHAAERFAYHAAAGYAAPSGSPSLANRSAVWLGLLFPWFGIPIALAFMMCEDRRKQEVGKLCLIWSLLATVLHILLFIVSLLGMREYIGLFYAGLLKGLKAPGGGGLEGFTP